MKKYGLTLFALILLAGTSCQEKIDIEKEKEAIKAVIEEETNGFMDRDFDRMAATFVEDSTNIRLSASKSGFSYYVGWEEISSLYKKYIENNPEPSTYKYVKTNYKIKVYKESAWAIFDEAVYDNEGEFIRKNISVQFLEKVNDKWRIVYFSLVNTTSYEDEEGDEEEEIEEDEGESETEDTE